jgi:CheY-like chemotaxis protein
MEKSVLLVENNADEILLAKRAFSKLGLIECLHIAESGEQAYQLLRKLSPETWPTLILLDLQMPGKDGLTVLREIRKCTSAVMPVVVLSSSDEPGDIAASYAAGANSYLRKPVDFDHFIQLMQDIYHYWVVRNILPPARRCA